MSEERPREGVLLAMDKALDECLTYATSRFEGMPINHKNAATLGMIPVIVIEAFLNECVKQGVSGSRPLLRTLQRKSGEA